MLLTDAFERSVLWLFGSRHMKEVVDHVGSITPSEKVLYFNVYCHIKMIYEWSYEYSCWCWVFVNPFIYVFGCSLYRSAFKLTYGLPMDSKDTTYLSGGAKFYRNQSYSNISRKGSLADIGSIVKNQSTQSF